MQDFVWSRRKSFLYFLILSKTNDLTEADTTSSQESPSYASSKLQPTHRVVDSGKV